MSSNEMEGKMRIEEYEGTNSIYFKELEKAYNNAGVKLYKEDGHIKEFNSVMNELSDIWESLCKEEQDNIIELTEQATINLE